MGLPMENDSWLYNFGTDYRDGSKFGTYEELIVLNIF